MLFLSHILATDPWIVMNALEKVKRTVPEKYKDMYSRNLILSTVAAHPRFTLSVRD